MKRLTIFKGLATISLVLVGIANVFAQNPITPEATPLYKHTTNSVDPVGPVAGEAIDSVTVTSLMKYYVLPDANVNPGFAVPFTNILSTFNWSTSGATGTAAGAIAVVPAAVHPNYKQVTWTGIGTINLSVVEVSTSGCTSGGSTTIPVSDLSLAILGATELWRRH